MNDLSASASQTLARPAPEPAIKPLTEPALLLALDEIASDSQWCPEIYLRDTVVPHGGE